MKKLVAAVLMMSGILVAAAPAARAANPTTDPAATPVVAQAATPEAAPAEAPAPRARVPLFRLGLGANYWFSVEDIADDDFDENGLSGLATFQFVPNRFFKVEVDVELRPEGFLGSSEAVWLPQAYLLLGNFIYAGAGAGMYIHDGKIQNDPFFAFRGGIDFPLGPVHLDINANYRFEGHLDGKNIGTDTVFLGAAVRFAL